MRNDGGNNPQKQMKTQMKRQMTGQREIEKAREKSSERDLQGNIGQCENIQDEHVKDS